MCVCGYVPTPTSDSFCRARPGTLGFEDLALTMCLGQVLSSRAELFPTGKDATDAAGEFTKKMMKHGDLTKDIYDDLGFNIHNYGDLIWE